MKYESNILERLIKTYGVVGNPKYVSEIIKQFIIQGKECYPNLFTYQADWLAHIDEFGLNPTYTVSYTGQSIYAPNTLERPVKSAILKGSTKYRDIDTGEFLETFEEGRNLELVSVKMPVLTTSNGDGTKTNILTVNEEVELRGVGEVKDELNLLTGELTQRIGEVVLDGSEDETWNNTLSNHYVDQETKAMCLPKSFIELPAVNAGKTNIMVNDFKVLNTGYTNGQGYDVMAISTNDTWHIQFVKQGVKTVEKWREFLQSNPIKIKYPLTTESVKTVDLTILDQNGQNVKQLMSFNGGTHFITKSLEGSPLPTVIVSVETDLEETLMVCSLEGNTL